MSHDVFISYSSRDKTIADAVCALLESRRIRCWIAPRDVLPGTEYGAAIVEAIATCKICVLIFSSDADKSPQVRREIERVVSKDKIIIPFRIENVLPTKAMEYALSNTHWLDALTAPLEGHIACLADAAGRILGIEQVSPKASLGQGESSDARSNPSADIFICDSLAHRRFAYALRDYLRERGYTVFLSDSESSDSDTAEFERSIFKALDDARVLIVIALEFDDLKSGWLDFEWRSFQGELISRRKNGAIVTVLGDLNIDQLPLPLRSCLCISCDSRAPERAYQAIHEFSRPFFQ